MKDLKTSRRSLKRKTDSSSAKNKRNKTCDECPSTFSTLNGLTEHKKIHEKLKELNYRCSICGETFHNAEKFRKHMLMHDVKLYKCESCGNSFKYLQSYMRHLKDYPEPHYFPCDKCNKVFKRQIFLNKHFCNSKDGNVNEDFYFKDESSTSTDSLENLNNRDVTLKKNEILVDLFEFKCKECDWIFSSKLNLMRHLDIYFDKHFIYPCCGNQLKKNSDIMSHICSKNTDKTDAAAMCVEEKLNETKEIVSEGETLNQTKEITSQKTKERRIYKCDICPAKFFRSHSLKYHKLKNPGEHNFQCGNCKKLYLDSESLDKHLCILQDNKEFKCSCLELFKNLEEFKNHVGHARPYSCCACKRKCSSLSNLINHVRTHTNEKPFVCSFCNKSFNVKTALTIHVRNHTGEKPYKCSKCSYECITKWNLDLHEKKHNSDRNDQKKFLCTECGTMFYMKHHLRRHIQTHSKKKEISCKLCTKTFNQISYLNKHLRMVHNKSSKCPDCKQHVDEKDWYQHHIDTGHLSFVCDPCKMVFRTKNKLRNHFQCHHTKFTCADCSKKFGSREKLEKHIEKNHGDSEEKKIIF